MSELECLFSLHLCCFACSDGVDCGNSEYEKIHQKKEEKKEENDEINVIFFYDTKDEKIDKNIHRIIFYDEYQKGYYNEYSVNTKNKEVLLIYSRNIKDISNTINYIHEKKGLLLKNNEKWIPKYIWIFN